LNPKVVNGSGEVKDGTRGVRGKGASVKKRCSRPSLLLRLNLLLWQRLIAFRIRSRSDLFSLAQMVLQGRQRLRSEFLYVGIDCTAPTHLR
jgi:hypothetical protein